MFPPRAADAALVMGIHSLSSTSLFFLHGFVWWVLAWASRAALRGLGLLRAAQAARANDTSGTQVADPLQAELLAAKNAAEAATRAKSEFLAVMSHEIRTPLGGVMGMLELLRKLPQGPQERHYLQLAHESAEALVDILDDILDASKIEAGRLSLESIPFEIRPELSRAVECMRVRAAFKNLQLSYNLSPDLPDYLKGDPTRLRQVVLNLLSNAIKFTAHGVVCLNAHCERRGADQVRLRISVSDTGIGMSPETVKRLFSKFVQGDASTTRCYGGTGLGLSIAKHIVELMHGTFSVESSLGEGSTFAFSVELPLAAAREIPSLTAGRPTALTPHDARLRVLCAEDEMINRVVTEGLVAGMGHTVEFAGDGDEVLSRLAAADYDLVLMDSRMPRKDGLEATREIRDPASLARDRGIFIVATTANASQSHRAACLAAGMNAFVAKPFREQDLHAALADAISFQRSRGKLTASLHAESVSPLWSAIPSAPNLSEDELLAMIESSSISEGTRDEMPATLTIVRQYLVDAPLRLEQARVALKKSDASALGLAAHSLKNISHYVSAERMCALCAQIEAAADARNWEHATELFPFAEAEFKSVKERLKSRTADRHEIADCR